MKTNVNPLRLKKGSKEAKTYMSKLRSMKKKKKTTKRKR